MHLSLVCCREKRMFHLDTFYSPVCLQKLRSLKNIPLQNETLTGMKIFLLLKWLGRGRLPFFRKIIRKSFVLFLNITFIEIFYFKQIYRYFNAINAKKVIYGAYFIYSYSGRRSIKHTPNIRNGLRKMNNKASKEKMLLEKHE